MFVAAKGVEGPRIRIRSVLVVGHAAHTQARLHNLNSLHIQDRPEKHHRHLTTSENSQTQQDTQRTQLEISCFPQSQLIFS